MNIGNLAVQVTASTAGLAAGLAKAKGMLAGFVSSIKSAKTFKGLKADLGGVSDQLRQDLASTFRPLNQGGNIPSIGDLLGAGLQGPGRAVEAVGGLTDALGGLMGSFFRIGSEIPIVGGAFRFLGDAVQGLVGVFGSVMKAGGQVLSFVGALAGEIAGLGLKVGLVVGGIAAGLGAYAVKLAAEAEQTDIAFSVLIGKAGDYRKILSDLRGFAAETPFGSREVLGAARMLAAYGTEAGQLLPTIKLLGEVSSATATPLNDLTYLFGTLRAQGRAYTVDIKQFANRGIPIWEELAKVMHVTTGEMQKLVEDGRVGFSEVAQAFVNMTAEGGRYAGMMEKQSKSLAGLWEAFKDNTILALTEVGNVLVETLDLKGLLGRGIDFSSYVRNNIDQIKPYIREAVEWAKALVNGAYVGIRTALTAGASFFEAMGRALGLFNENVGSSRDWLLSLEFNFAKAKMAGFDFAIGLIKIFEEVRSSAESIGNFLSRNFALPFKKLQFQMAKDLDWMLRQKEKIEIGTLPTLDAKEFARRQARLKELENESEWVGKLRTELDMLERSSTGAQMLGGGYTWGQKAINRIEAMKAEAVASSEFGSAIASGLPGKGILSAQVIIDTIKTRSGEPFKIPVELITPHHLEMARKLGDEVANPLEAWMKEATSIEDLYQRGAFIGMDAVGGGDVAALAQMRAFGELQNKLGLNNDVRFSGAVTAGSKEAYSAEMAYRFGQQSVSYQDQVLQAQKTAETQRDQQLKEARKLYDALIEMVRIQEKIPGWDLK